MVEQTIEIDVAVPEGLGATDALKALKEELESGLGKNLDQLVTYCQNEKIDFKDWKTGTLEEEQLTEVQEVFGQIGVGAKLSAMLKDPAGESYETAKKFLDKMVGLMDSSRKEMDEFKGAAEELSGGMSGDFLGDATGMLKENFAKHPWQSVLAGGILVISAWHFAHSEQYGDYVKGAAAVGAIAWAANFFSGGLKDNGRTWLQEAFDAYEGNTDPDADLDSFLDRFKGNDDVDVGLLRQAFELGDIRFSVFLEEYSKASSSEKINMRRLQRKSRAGLSSSIDSDAFDDRHGEGLYALLDTIVEEVGLDQLREKYGKDGKWSDFSFMQVVAAEFRDENGLAPEEDEEEATSGSKKKKRKKKGGAALAGAGAAGSAPSEEPENLAPSEYGAELAKIPGFESVDAKLLDDGTATMMGYTFDYTRKEYAGGVTRYQFTERSIPAWSPGSGRPVWTFDVGDAIDAPKQETLLNTMKDYTKKKTGYLLDNKLGLGALQVDLRWTGTRWTSNYPFALEASLGIPVSLTAEVEIRTDGTDALNVNYNGVSLKSAPELERETKGYAVGEQLKRSHAFFEGMDIHITDIDPSTNIPRKMRGTANGSVIEVYWDAAKRDYEITNFALSSGFIERERAALETDSDLNTVFDELLEAGEKFSNWRMATDILSFHWGSIDSTNHLWAEIVSFKRDQLKQRYLDGLRELDGSSKAPMDLIQELSDLKAETIGRAKHQFALLPAQMAQANDAQFARIVQDFYYEGYDEPYRRRYTDFSAKMREYDTTGTTEASSPHYVALRMKLERFWYSRTSRFEGQPSLLKIQQDYCAYVQGEIVKILDASIKDDTHSGSAASAWWQKWVDSAVTAEDLGRRQGQFDAIKSYDDWLAWTKRSPIEQLTPQIQAFTDDIEIEPLPLNKARFTINKSGGSPTVWEAELKPDGQGGQRYEITSGSMTPEMITAQVEYVAGLAEFNSMFGNLDTVFQGVGGSVQEGKWSSLVDYKRQEVLENYRQDLEAIMNDPALAVNPAAKAAAWTALEQDFGNRYTGVFVAYRRAVEDRLSAMAHPETELTEYKFGEIYRGLERLGYGSAFYAAQMQALRRGLQGYNFAGLEDLDDRGAFDIMNMAVTLHHRYTGWMEDVPKAKWTETHSQYFQYVGSRLFGAMRKAEGSNAGTGTWLRDAIGSDEIPAELDIVPFDEFIKNPSQFSDPDFGFALDDIKDQVDAGTSKAIVNPDGTPVVDHSKRLGEIQDILAAVRKKRLDDRIVADPDEIDVDEYQAAEPYIKGYTEVTTRKIYEEGLRQQEYIQQYEEVMDEIYLGCRDSSIWPWTWFRGFDPDVIPEEEK